MRAWFGRANSPAALLGFLLVLHVCPAAQGGETRLAISGYDPVAYFTDGKPVPGLPEFEHVWHDARWRFASASHRDLFVGDPNRHAPQYDGYCAGGVVGGAVFGPHKDTVDPEAWAIVDGKLYLTHTRHVGALAPQPGREYQTGGCELVDRRASARTGARWAALYRSPAFGDRLSPGGGQRANIGGQLAVEKEGNVVGKGDMRAQIEQASKNVQVCLEVAGAKASDIVLTRAYVTDADAFKQNADVFARYLGPATTVTPAASLSAGPDFLVEIEAVANLN